MKQQNAYSEFFLQKSHKCRVDLCVLLTLSDITEKSVLTLVTNKPKYFIKKNSFLWLWLKKFNYFKKTLDKKKVPLIFRIKYLLGCDNYILHGQKSWLNPIFFSKLEYHLRLLNFINKLICKLKYTKRNCPKNTFNETVLDPGWTTNIRKLLWSIRKSRKKTHYILRKRFWRYKKWKSRQKNSNFYYKDYKFNIKLYEGPKIKKLKKRKVYNLFLNKRQRQIKTEYHVNKRTVNRRQQGFETRYILRHQRRRYRHKHCFNHKNKFMVKTYVKKILFLKNLNYIKYLKKSFYIKAKTFKMRKLYGLYHFRLDLFCLGLKLSLSLKHIRIAIVNGFIWVNWLAITDVKYPVKIGSVVATSYAYYNLFKNKYYYNIYKRVFFFGKKVLFYDLKKYSFQKKYNYKLNTKKFTAISIWYMAKLHNFTPFAKSRYISYNFVKKLLIL